MKFLARSLPTSFALTLLTLLAQAQDATTTVGAFELHFDAERFETPFTGQVFVAFSKEGEPREDMHRWFGAPPVLRFQVEKVVGGETHTFGQSKATRHYPLDWESVESGGWRVQAVARLSHTGRQAGLGEGDVVSAVVEIEYDPGSEESVRLVLDTPVSPKAFEDSERARLFAFPSPALSKFHGFDYSMNAGVLLPLDYDPKETYPVIYIVTGFGGSHHSIHRWSERVADTAFDRCIVVIPDASNRYGHSVFCDSESIGPWGEALVRELIPALEAEYGGAGAEHRYVTGVSSGGWSSLWLQVAYPDDFAGCWSHAPDPIDFYDFQQINLYDALADGTPRNMYVDEEGASRPLARRGEEVLLTYEEFVRREHVLNPGGQIRSFEATFSPLDENGTPRRVFDVETGLIDHEAARAWRKYDISHTLLTQWSKLRARLRNKIHVYAGEVDTFYLEGAVERFRKLADEAGMLDEMVVEVIPGMPHTLHGPGQEAMLKTIEERWAERAQRLEGARTQ